MRPYRLLITARDAAAALHLREVAEVARTRPEFALEIVAQMPAAQYFHARGMAVRSLGLPPAKARESAEALALLAAARDIVETTRPDAVLCGLSTPFDGGIDEAVTAVFDGPRFVMQDFWGEANLIFGVAADLYFALDDEGVHLSAERHGVPAVAIGSPRHAAYSAIDIAGIRHAERDRLGIPRDAVVFGFFGQALHALSGYRRTQEAWIDAVSAQSGPCVALYRPHPRERESESLGTFDRLRRGSVQCLLSEGVDVEHSLLACDVVCSAFSNCTYDAAYLNYFSDQPLITPLSMFFDEEIVTYFRRMVRLAEFPYLKAGLVMPVRTSGSLADILARAATVEEKARFWNRARALTDPAGSSTRLLDRIMAVLNGSNPITRAVG